MKAIFTQTGVVLYLIILMSGCATIPGATKQAQVVTIDNLVKDTLNDLYEQEPKTKEEIASSVGYAIFNNKITKVPLVGAGSGYGVAIRSQNDEKTYLKMARLDVGGGWGARSVRPVIIFQDEAEFNSLIKGTWNANAGAEAAAKVGDTGGAGGSRENDEKNDKGYSIHMITDAGVSATVTAGVIRISPLKLKD